MTTSVIMPAYNSAAYIAAAIASVVAQSEPDWELIVSDDGSRDDTVAIVQQAAASDPRIRLLTGASNRGPAQARNAAIAAARGRYIAFLDSDDLWKPEKLARQLAFMQARDIAFSFTSYDRIDAEGHVIDTHLVHRPATYDSLLKSCVIGCLTAVYDTQKLGKVMMPDIRKRQDFGLWLRLLKRVEAAYPLEESLALYRVHANSVSANKLSAARYTWALYHDVEKLGLMRSAWYFAHYAAHGVFNTYVRPRLPPG
jgi:glycosyltransferase involved in cell wall biosynthesis